MGAGNSKQTTDHVFTADGPVRFSQSVVDTFQKSPETDSTRSRNLELQVQTRLKTSLEKIRDTEKARLNDLTDRLTTWTDTTSQEPQASSAEISSSDTPSRQGQQREQQDKDRAYVAREVEALKLKLDRRKRIEKADSGVETARTELVECLRTNEKRPLDCWSEVEGFKREVARYESQFLDSTLRP